MPKDKCDVATIDIFNPNKHGGYRAGSGPKPSEIKKVKLGWSVTSEAKSNIETLAEGKDYSASDFLDYIMKNVKEAPNKLE